MARRRSTPESVAHKRLERAAESSPGPVLDAAAAFLAVRQRSVAETRRRLLYLGYREELVERVIGQLLELGYLDDAAFARSWIESRDRARPRGEVALRRELALKGVPRNLIGEALEQRASSTEQPVDMAAALRLLERRRSSIEREADPVRRRQKAYALLARNGFDPETCRAAALSVAGQPSG